jgi:hypothetical protein
MKYLISAIVIMIAFPAYAGFDAFEHNKVCTTLSSVVTSQLKGGIQDHDLALKSQALYAKFGAQAENKFAAAGSTLVVMDHLECDKDRMRKVLFCVANGKIGKLCMW